ncbi:MAG: endolytic transglycosylase MltG [Candidatus Eisenbacteria bacterium]|nr:endolytic transglycosylase MltG [Candidatus Eisenbacteria bacterium]
MVLKRRSRDELPPEPARRGPHWFLKELIIVAIVGGLLLGAFAGTLALVSLRDLGGRVMVEVPEGASLRQTARSLHEQGIVGHPALFALVGRALGYADEIQAGTYEFGPSTSDLRVLLAVRHGDVAGRTVTVPEGFRAAQIAALMESSLGIDRAEFTDHVHDPELITELGITAPSLEGYLHPDTYRFNVDAAALDIIRRMVEETHEFLDDRRLARADSLDMSVREVLTLASIIEAEALYDLERPRISAVYHNRLERGWRLEADPTVRYAIGRFRRRLYYGDLDVDSPYNTYRNKGLPPGPICSPGKASIDAALYPIEGSDEFFFVADRDGTHRFSRTFEEHVLARKMIQLERERAAQEPEPSSSAD